MTAGLARPEVTLETLALQTGALVIRVDVDTSRRREPLRSALSASFAALSARQENLLRGRVLLDCIPCLQGRMCVVGQPEAELVAEGGVGRFSALATGDHLRCLDSVRLCVADEAARGPAAEREAVHRGGTQGMGGGVDRVVAAVGRESRQSWAEVAEAGGGRDRERPVERVRERDPVELAPAVVVLARRAAERGGEGRARGEVQRVLDALEEQDVTRGLRGRDAGDGEEVEA